MTSASVLQNDSIWLQHQNYFVVPLNRRLSSRIQELSDALRRGVAAFPDSRRKDFYNVELTDGCAYVHIHDNTQTVYLVAYSRNYSTLISKLNDSSNWNRDGHSQSHLVGN